jgi:hypothetical protein
VAVEVFPAREGACDGAVGPEADVPIGVVWGGAVWGWLAGEGDRIEHLRAVAAPAGVAGRLVWGGRLGGLCGEVGITGIGIAQASPPL